MGFRETFSQHFDHPPPFELPAGAHDNGNELVTDPSVVVEELFGVLGAQALSKLPPGKFIYTAIKDVQPNVTFYLMIVDDERYFYFREQIRDVFNANASPEACYATLVKVYGIFAKRTEGSFKMAYSNGTLQVNNKTLKI